MSTRTPSKESARLDLRLVCYAIGNALATMAEWGALIGLLVHVFERSGPEAVGIASFTAILPYLVMAPLTARVAQSRRSATIRVVRMLGQAVGFGTAAASDALGWPIWVGVLGTAIGFNVFRCWVSEYTAIADLDANANAVAIEQLVLQNEGWERDPAVTEPAET